MKKIIPLSLLAYLGCAAPQSKPPLIDLQNDPINDRLIIESKIETVEQPPKKSQAQEDTEFIVSRLEQKMAEYPGVVMATANVHSSASFDTNFSLQVMYDSREFCSVDSTKPLFKSTLEIDFHRSREVNGNYQIEEIVFFHGPPLYVLEDLNVMIVRDKQNTSVFPRFTQNYYGAFPEARKLYESALHYLAEQLKGEFGEIEKQDNFIYFHFGDKLIEAGSKEEELLTSQSAVVEAIPKQENKIEDKIVAVYACKP